MMSVIAIYGYFIYLMEYDRRRKIISEISSIQQLIHNYPPPTQNQ
jgi:hypothetical protein